MSTDGVTKYQSIEQIIESTKTNKAATRKTGGDMGKNDFLNLLVTQLRYQDPLEPASNTEYIAQLATFSQVEELQNVSESMTNAQANGLMGKTVVIKTTSDAGVESFVGGTVERVVDQDGKTYLGVDGKLYDVNDLDSVVDADFYKKYYLNGGNSTTPIGGVYVDTSASTTT